MFERLAPRRAYGEAERHLEAAFELAVTPLDKSRIEALLGEVSYKQAQLVKSIGLYSSALRRLGAWVPKSSLGLMLSLSLELFKQALHSIFPNTWFIRGSLTDARTQLIIRLLDRSSMSYWWRNTPRLLWAHISAMNRAETLPTSRSLAFSYGIHSCVITVVGWTTRSLTYGEKSREISEQLDDLWGRGHAHAFLGFGHYGSARHEECVQEIDKAIPLLVQSGDQWELNCCKWFKAMSLYCKGELQLAETTAHEAFESTLRIGEDGLAHCVHAHR